MKISIAGVVLLCLGIACAERTFPLRSLAARAASAGDGNQPFWFLGAPRKSQGSIQSGDYDDDDNEENSYDQQGSFAIVQDDDDVDGDDSNDDEIVEVNFENDDDDADDSELSGNVIGVLSLSEANALFSNRNNNGMIDLEEREMDYEDDDDDNDGESGDTAIYLPRGVLENIPKGSILALVDDSESEGRAMRIVHRRRRGRPNQRRRRRGNNNRRRRRPNRRRGGNKRRRVVRPGRRGNRRRVVNRRRRTNVIRL